MSYMYNESIRTSDLSNQKKRFVLLPQEHTVMVRQTSKWGQTFLLTLVGLGATVFATAWIYRIDEVITVQGILISKDGGVEVKSPIDGQLVQVNVKNGETVKKDQTLLKYDVQELKESEITLQKQLTIEKEKLNDQKKTNAQRKITLKRNIDLTQKILERMKPLEKGGAISEIQILGQENKLQQQNDELLQLEINYNQQLNDSLARTERIKGNLRQIMAKLKHEYVKSTIGGVVTDLKPDNEMYVTKAAEPLMKIVPKGKLNATVNIANSDIGFIKKGQQVKVRVDAFPYTEYGELTGRIDRIGADAKKPNELVRNYHFPVDIVLDKSYLKTKDGVIIKLQSGMTVTTNLKLRDRRVIELLGDLFNDRNESLKRLRQP